MVLYNAKFTLLAFSNDGMCFLSIKKAPQKLETGVPFIESGKRTTSADFFFFFSGSRVMQCKLKEGNIRKKSDPVFRKKTARLLKRYAG